MKVRRVISAMAVAAMTISGISAVASGAAASTSPVSSVQSMIKRGVTSFGRSLPGGGARLTADERARNLSVVNRSLSARPRAKNGLRGVPSAKPNLSVPRAKTEGQFMSFEGLNHFDQRFANGGNQFSLEPPDQGLCVGNHYVIEVINDVLRVYSDLGVPLSGVQDLNTFYGYPPEFIRPAGPFGPFPTDPSCYYDPEHKVFEVIALILDTDPSDGSVTGTNHLDIAVSQTSNPLGLWNLYSIPVQDDGTQGTPNHHCTNGPCIGDFPHLGADRWGFYITTNEYDFFGPNFHTAQIYAMSKNKLASGASSVPFVHLANLHLGGQNGFTVWPAQANPGHYNLNNNGTEYFLSSRAAAETGNQTGFANSIGLWTLTNTRSLNGRVPRIHLTNRVLRSAAYGIPPLSNQAEGNIPLGDCMANPPCFGFSDGDIANSSEGTLDSSDTRMFQVWYAAGRLWSALGTIVAVPIPDPPFYRYEAAALWFVVNPNAPAHVQRQGYLVANPNGDGANNITYPSIAVLPSGKGILGASLAGVDFYPSQVWVGITAAGIGGSGGPNGGVGPQDGFTEYLNFSGGFPRPRWGDYSAAVTQGSTIWIANEVINQTCDDTEFNGDPTCGGTRTALANWSTQITQVIP